MDGGSGAEVNSEEVSQFLHYPSAPAVTIAVGDANVHSTQWLRWSSGESAEGTALFRACQQLGARQVVRGPTRESHLLDLTLTDLDNVSAKVIPGVSDHEIVISTLKLSMPECEVVRRKV